MQVDAFELRDQWQRMDRLAKKAVSEASERCEELARAEAAYYAAKTATAMQLKADGNPVTYIETIIKGHPDVAPHLFAYTLAEGKYKAAQEAVRTYRDSERYAYDEYRRSMEGDRQ